MQKGYINTPTDGIGAEPFHALLAGELAVVSHFQPIVDLYQGTVTGYEALARFPAEFGASPDVCLARARQLGLGLQVEDVLFRQGLKARHQLPENCFLSLNVGPEFLLSTECCIALEQERNLGGLVFEVTEEVSIVEYDLVRERLALIRKLGGAVAVDDAGAGYASLSHILEIKPEFIKIDRRIVQNCHQDRAKSTLIEMLGAAANRLDAWILAEGVECAGELEELLLLGVPLAQGYFLARPAPQMLACSHTATGIITTRRDLGPELQLKGLFATGSCCHSVEEAEELLRVQQDQAVVVVTDHWDRPARLLQRHPLLGVRQLSTFLKVQIETEPGAVLQRALLRELSFRYDPIVVIGPEGQYLGVTDVDRLMNSILGSPFPKSRRLLQ